MGMRPISAIVPCIFLLTACSQQDGHQHPQLKTGEQLYMRHCASCHRGAGGGAFLEGVPPVKDSSMTYRQMTDHIRGVGRAEGSRMPKFSTMSKAEAGLITLYVRSKLHKQ